VVKVSNTNADASESTKLILSQRNKFIELRAARTSLRECSELLDISKSALYEWAKKLKCEIENARAIEEEEFFAKLRIAKRYRLRSFAEIFLKADEELKKRSFADLPTEKLLDLMIKVEGKVTELYREPVILKESNLKEELFSDLLEGGKTLERQVIV
jgi:hypothetical protein